MNTAKELFDRYAHWHDAIPELDDLAVEKDQDWEGYSTTWIFGDGSRIVASGPEWRCLGKKPDRYDRRYVDSDDDNAIFRAWLGESGMGAWTGTDEGEFLEAIEDELRYAVTEEEVPSSEDREGKMSEKNDLEDNGKVTLGGQVAGALDPAHQNHEDRIATLEANFELLDMKVSGYREVYQNRLDAGIKELNIRVSRLETALDFFDALRTKFLDIQRQIDEEVLPIVGTLYILRDKLNAWCMWLGTIDGEPEGCISYTVRRIVKYIGHPDLELPHYTKLKMNTSKDIPEPDDNQNAN